MPVFVVASGPRVIRAAAELADRVTLALGADPERIRWGAELAREVNPAVKIGAYVNVVVDEDVERARALGAGSITSFARFGIESAYPMLPRDQICVLGVGTVLEQPVVRGGALAVGWTLSLTLAFDPGAIGGALAAEFLGALRRHLEDPLSMML